MSLSIATGRAFATLLWSVFFLVPVSVAQPRGAAESPGSAAPVPVAETSVTAWLQRTSAAARQRSYVGTFVVSAATGNLSSARIWHAREGDLQMERIEALSGPPRSIFRRNDQVSTFWPETHVVKKDRRESVELFPNLPGAPQSAIDTLYEIRVIGRGRVAGLDADVVQLVPRDAMRFGYRIWSERRSGLVVKLQTLDAKGRVVEQSAFSELELDAPVKAEALARMMNDTAGYRVEKNQLQRTTALSEGWALESPVAGFGATRCYQRAMGEGTGRDQILQWIFSDGLASVSLFLERYDAQQPRQEGALSMGATHTLARRLSTKDGDWWLTAVGEVPARTLEAFAHGLVRTR